MTSATSALPTDNRTASAGKVNKEDLPDVKSINEDCCTGVALLASTR
jgi:hypothetical protein